MRRKMLIGLLLTLTTSLMAYAETSNIAVRVANGSEIIKKFNGDASQRSRHRLDEIIYSEDWEGGLNGWVATDLTATPGSWHIDDVSPFGGTGMSWWVGDPEVGANGGYLDDWYMVLDSPTIQLGATPMLRFWHRWSCEDPGGEPAGYNGWDGCNIRISTNNGSTWTVIPGAALTPTYTRTSLYSFGFQHGEGPNVPGWCNTTSGANWQQAVANLSAWANQSVKIRWAFASDPAYSTPDNGAMFGWMVDAIRVYSGADTVFSSNGDNATGWTSTTNVPTGGNLWRLDTDNTSPNGPQVLVCNSAANDQYNANMNNVIESPLIDLRDRDNGICLADVQLQGEVICAADEFPDCDYFGIEVSVDSGFSWCAISNPTCDPDLQNFVYTGLPTTWASFNESYNTPMDISALVGQVVKFRFSLESNADANVSTGPMFDGFTIDYQAGLPNDVSCYTLQVRYPNVIGQPTRIRAYFRNPGNEPQNPVQAFFRTVGQGARRFTPDLNLIAGASATRDSAFTFAGAGPFIMKAWTNLAGDQDLQNDTATVENIAVRAATEDWELGYDNRPTQPEFRFNYATGQGPLVKFTPFADGISSNFDINTIRVKYASSQVGNLPIRYHVYRGSQNQPGVEIYNQLITINDADATGDWFDLDISGDADTRNIANDFWVWLEVTSTANPDRYPQILGDTEQSWSDIHNYTWSGAGTPTQAAFFYQLHAEIHSNAADADDEVVLLPANWSLEQNYPNPFNPSTEIRYTVPKTEKMTLKVYNLMGQEVATLVNNTVPAGQYTAVFDGSKVSSGVYVYRLESESFNASQKMLLLK